VNWNTSRLEKPLLLFFPRRNWSTAWSALCRVQRTVILPQRSGVLGTGQGRGGGSRFCI